MIKRKQIKEDLTNNPEINDFLDGMEKFNIWRNNIEKRTTEISDKINKLNKKS